MSMVPDFAFEVEPIAIGKQNTKRDNLARHHLAHGIKVTAAFRKIGNLRGVSFFISVPNCIKIDA